MNRFRIGTSRFARDHDRESGDVAAGNGFAQAFQ